MAGFDFNAAASTKLSEVEKPPLPPVGIYRWRVSKLPEVRTTTDGKWDVVDFTVNAVEAVEADFSDYKGDVHNIIDRLTFMFNKEDEVAANKTLWRLRTFLEQHLKCADESMSLKEGLNAAFNQQFMAPLTWRPDKNDASLMYTQIGNTAPIE